MMKPFALLADLHLHNWQSFSTALPSGINSRLNGLLTEVQRAGDELLKAGGDTMYLAGDVFHVRGSIAPSVLNPTRDTFADLIAAGITICILPGNHDLEGKHSTRLGSAVTALEGIGCHVFTKPHLAGEGVLCVPWFEKVADLRAWLDDFPAAERGQYDVLLHAPIDGVITGLPLHGLDPKYLAGLGFKRIFAGHYHNHKDMGGGVWSIGALAHHTWSDVNSKAGFLIVHEDRVEWRKSHLPEFIDITGEMDESEATLLAEGNYVRAKVTTAKMGEVEALRKMFQDAGAKGVVIQTIKAPTAVRTGAVTASVNAGASLEQSIAEYVAAQSFPDAARIATECQKVLAEAGV